MLIPRGWRLMALARGVGIGRSAANVWKNGATVRDENGTVLIIPPLEPLALRPISARFLSEAERIRIADLASLVSGQPILPQRVVVRPRRLVGSYAEIPTALGNTGPFTPTEQQHCEGDSRNR